MYGKFCTVEDLKRQAITIKLYDNSVWANLGDGRFIDRQTKKIRPVSLLGREPLYERMIQSVEKNGFTQIGGEEK